MTETKTTDLMAAADAAFRTFDDAWQKVIRSGESSPEQSALMATRMTAMLAVDVVAELVASHTNKGGNEFSGDEYARLYPEQAVAGIGDGCAEWWESRRECMTDLAAYVLALATVCDRVSRKAARMSE